MTTIQAQPIVIGTIPLTWSPPDLTIRAPGIVIGTIPLTFEVPPNAHIQVPVNIDLGRTPIDRHPATPQTIDLGRTPIDTAPAVPTGIYLGTTRIGEPGSQNLSLGRTRIASLGAETIDLGRTPIGKPFTVIDLGRTPITAPKVTPEKVDLGKTPITYEGPGKPDKVDLGRTPISYKAAGSPQTISLGRTIINWQPPGDAAVPVRIDLGRTALVAAKAAPVVISLGTTPVPYIPRRVPEPAPGPVSRHPDNVPPPCVYRLVIRDAEDKNWLNLTPYLRSFDIRYGSRWTNELGYIATPLGGRFDLLNVGGEFSDRLLPGLSTSGGHRVRLVMVCGSRAELWDVWSAGITSAKVVGIEATAQLLIEGDLNRINASFSEVYVNMDADGTAGEYIHRVLDNIAWPTSRRDIDTAGLRLEEHKAQIAKGAGRGLLRWGGSVGQALAAFDALVAAEQGVMWDAPNGLHFLGHAGRRGAGPARHSIGNGGVVSHHLDPGNDSVVNSITMGEDSTIVGQLANFFDVFRETKPIPGSGGTVVYNANLPAGDRRELALTLDLNYQDPATGLVAAYVQTVDPLQAGVHYTVGHPDVDITVHNDGFQVRIETHNRGPDTRLQLFGLSGKLAYNLATGIGILPLRSDESIRLHGRHHVDLPETAMYNFANLPDVRRRTAALLETLSGVGAFPPKRRLDLLVDPRRDPDTFDIPVGSWVDIRDIDLVPDMQMVLDSVNHRFDALARDHRHTISLEFTER